ncbi:MAG: hypothetical protein IJ639_05510 [Ruminococcus sp.]|nr:hypothetical protein [Ruminococcus sp.]
MKKLLSMLCVLAVMVGIIAIGVVSAAADVPTTVLDVKSGDKVTYKLSLSGVPEKIVGCDFSVYYDSSAFTLDSVADFNDSTNDEDWQATINPDLDGEVRGNWSILKGVSFSNKRNIVTLNLTATKDAKAHISYFVRYMYDDSVFDSDERPQIDQYMFTCDITKNGEAVVENAEPELNVEEEQPNGLFANSRTGKSADANKALTGDSIKANGGAADGADSGNNSGNNNSGNNSGNNNSANNNSGNNSGNNATQNNGSGSGQQTATQSGTNGALDATGENQEGKANTPNTAAVDDENTVETDAEGNIIATAAPGAKGGSEGGSSPLMWFIIAAVVIIAGGCIAYVVVKGKKKAPADNPADTKDDDAQ